MKDYKHFLTLEKPIGYAPERIEVDGKTVTLYAPYQFQFLSREERKGICNGIGAATGLSKYVPNTIWGLDVSYIGDIHDYSYWRGGTPKDRETADAVFYHNLLVVIEARGGILAPLRRRRAGKYYLALRVGGWAHFGDGEREERAYSD